MNTLDQWKTEASPAALLNDFNALRVLALIDLVRKKDEALKFAESVIDLKHPVVKAFNPIKSALELTEELK